MTRAVSLRLVLVVVGFAAVVYGTASVTGGWMGTPPWWERPEPYIDWLYRTGTIDSPMYDWETYWRAEKPVIPVIGREWASASLVGMGIALVSVGAWPRRRHPAPAP